MKVNHIVSIIIPTKNEEKMIDKCLTAISKLNTSHERYEIIIVDNNSSDRTIEIAEKFSVKIIKTAPKPIHVSSSRNIGVKHATGNIIAFLDADCIVSKEWLNNALIHFNQGDACMVGHKYKIPANSSLVAKSWDFIFTQRQNKKNSVNWIPAGNMFVLKNCFESIGGFDESLVTSEDVDLCYRLKKLEHSIIADPDVQVTHLGTPQTYFELYKKELWHGIGAVQSFIRDIRKVRNSRPIIYGFFFITLAYAVLLSLLCSILTQSLVMLYISIFLTVTILTAPFILAINDSVKSYQYNLFFGVFMVYLIYGVARAVCLYRVFKNNISK